LGMAGKRCRCGLLSERADTHPPPPQGVVAERGCTTPARGASTATSHQLSVQTFDISREAPLLSDSCWGRWQARTVEHVLNALHKNQPTHRSLLQYKKSGEPYWASTMLIPIWEGSVEGNCRGHLWLKGDVTYPKVKRIGKYVAGREIGAGASGTVLLGKDSKTGELVRSLSTLQLGLMSCDQARV
jgi:hypothetical protein